MSDIRDMINTEMPNVDFHNNEIKCFIEAEFGDSVQFCKSSSKNMSTFIFSSSVSVSDITNVLRSTDCVQNAARDIRKALLTVDFGLEGKFGDEHELKDAWKNTDIPDIVLSFFATLFNKSKVSFQKQGLNQTDPNDLFQDDDMDSSLKLKALFQILYYYIHNGQKKTPLHLINGNFLFVEILDHKWVDGLTKK